MILIGENINVMSTKIGAAMKNKDAKPIRELALAQQKAGMDYMDINIGPSKRRGPDVMDWIVKTIQRSRPGLRCIRGRR
jgi:5-methyltetrahydrofolate corrinoid/iron sulfur protein methyltransferase